MRYCDSGGENGGQASLACSPHSAPQSVEHVKLRCPILQFTFFNNRHLMPLKRLLLLKVCTFSFHLGNGYALQRPATGF